MTRRAGATRAGRADPRGARGTRAGLADRRPCVDMPSLAPRTGDGAAPPASRESASPGLSVACEAAVSQMLTPDTKPVVYS
ncbi:hypothetical protein WG70_25875 [Burkholderia oklahomensis EO147]|nr:hypothetical protein WG70_25875 [Burkholderia oklahomensis EO147]KUY63036.1 hypothetical protein WG70_05030 [Burkholderia oklahomensis EO147]